jgi:outer membrane protein OmpA-like peptidoglycan-associated protein
MTKTRRVPRAGAFAGRVLLLLPGCAGIGAAFADQPAVLDSQSIVRSLQSPAYTTRALLVAPRTSGSSPTNERKVALDIRFANDSDRLTSAAHAQLAQLGAALNSPELAAARFLIAGHTSATGTAEYNLRLSEARARAVRSYLLEHFSIAPERMEATGYGFSRPLSNFPPSAPQQRRVEVSALPPAS